MNHKVLSVFLYPAQMSSLGALDIFPPPDETVVPFISLFLYKEVQSHCALTTKIPCLSGPCPGYAKCSYSPCSGVFLDAELLGTWLFLFHLGTLVALKSIL